jgi:hypothetical protein
MQVSSSFVLSHRIEHNRQNRFLNEYHISEKLF